jgi:aspartate racemase
MKMIGIIGGIGPESTIDYYRQMIALYRQRTGGADYPALLVNSIDMTRMLALVASGDLAALAAYLAAETERLAAAGADLALMASNTPHIAFDRVKRLARIPMISIVEETARRAKRDGFTRLGLFGTRFTMQGGFYQSVFEASGMAVVTPPPGTQEFIHEHYMGEFVKGIFRDEVKRALADEAERMKRDEDIQALILGGTELPLILSAADLPGMGVLNTTAIHVEAAIGFSIAHNDNARD